MQTRRARHHRKGFALLIVVLISALAAVAAVALLDLVGVDLTMVGEQRRTGEASAIAAGAVLEILADQNADLFFPDLETVGLTVRYAGRGLNGVHSKGPDGAAPVALTENNSAFTRDVGGADEQRYDADVALLRVVPRLDSGLTVTRSFVYEVTVDGISSGGRASRQMRAQLFRDISMQAGTQLAREHAR